jgi:hypothetical protein
VEKRKKAKAQRNKISGNLLVALFSDLLADIINIPVNMRHKKVEIIVFPYDEEGKEGSPGIKKNMKGLVNKYANLNYLPLEQSAWAEAVREAHKNN